LSKSSLKSLIFYILNRNKGDENSEQLVKTRMACEISEEQYIFTLLPQRRIENSEVFSSYEDMYVSGKSSSFMLMSGDNSNNLKQWFIPKAEVDEFLYTNGSNVDDLKYFIEQNIILTDYEGLV